MRSWRSAKMAGSLLQKCTDLGRSRLIARIALAFAAAALAGLPLLIALSRLAGTPPDGSEALNADLARLPLLMALSGLILATVIGLATWIIALHGSFRVVGPLHRFCMNLEQGLASGRLPRLRIRATDEMQDEARYFEDAASRLDRHLDALAAALESAALAVRRGRGSHADGQCPGERVHRLIEELRL